MNSKYRDEGFLSDKDEADFDMPAAKHKSVLRKKREDDGETDENERVSANRGYFVRRTLREREMEEERQHRQMFHRQELEDSDVDDKCEDGEPNRIKAPPIVRIFAWVALLVIFFAGGYVGTNYFFSKIDKPEARIGNVVGSGSEIQTGTGLPTAVGLGDASYKLYMPQANGDFEERAIKIRQGLVEDDIRRMLTVYIDGLKELTEFEPGVQVLNIYRSGDWLYIDMSQDFLKSLKILGKNKSTLALTGLVRTMQDNFPPIKKIKFYIDGRESRDKNPVDIENAWELKS